MAITTTVTILALVVASLYSVDVSRHGMASSSPVQTQLPQPTFSTSTVLGRVTLGTSSYNSAGGCLDVQGVPVSVLVLDGLRLSPDRVIASMAPGSVHTIVAASSYTGQCNGCAECGLPKNGSLTVQFSYWRGSLNSSNTYTFTVPSNGTMTLVAVYRAP